MVEFKFFSWALFRAVSFIPNNYTIPGNYDAEIIFPLVVITWRYREVRLL